MLRQAGLFALLLFVTQTAAETVSIAVACHKTEHRFKIFRSLRT